MLEELKQHKNWCLCFAKTGDKFPLTVVSSWVEKIKAIIPNYFESGNNDFITSESDWLNYTVTISNDRQKVYTGDLKNVGATMKHESSWLTYNMVEKICRNSVMLFPVNRERQLSFGFVFTQDLPFAVIDLDRKDGISQQEIAYQNVWLDKLNSYTERSISGTGYHVIIKGKIDPEKYPNTKGTGASGIRSGTFHKSQGIVGFEVYSQDRFIVMTEDCVEDRPHDIEERQDVLDELCATLKSPTVSNNIIDIDTEFQYDVDSLSLEINFAIVGIMQSCDRDNFLALFEARCNFVYDNEPSKSVYNEENVLSYPSQSEADFALMTIICKYVKEDTVAKAIFAQSELAKRPKATRVDYLNRMICGARENEANEYAIPDFLVEEKAVSEESSNLVEQLETKKKLAKEAEKKALIDEFINKNYLDVDPETVLVNSKWREEKVDPTYSVKELFCDVLYASGLITQLKRVNIIPSPDFMIFASDEELSYKRLLDKGYITTKGFNISDNNALIIPPVSSGVLYEMTKWSYETRIKPILEVSLASCLGILSGVVGKMWQLPTGTGLNNYIILSARSGVGKEGLHSTKNDLIYQFACDHPDLLRDLRRHVVDDDFVSGQALVKRCLQEAGSTKGKKVSSLPDNWNLMRKRYVSFVNFQSEFGKNLGQMSDCKAGSPADTLKAQYLKLYTGSAKTSMLSAMSYSNEEESIDESFAPAFSVIGETTIAGYADALSPQMAQDGFLSRFVTITYKGKTVLQNKLGIHKKIPKRIIEWVKDLCAQESTLSGNAVTGVCEPRFIQVDFTEEADKYNDMLEQWSVDMLDQAGDKEYYRQAWVRFQLKILKLAGLCAVCQNPSQPVVSIQHMAWATRLVLADVTNMYELITNGDTNLTGNSENTQAVTLVETMKRFLTSDNSVQLASMTNLSGHIITIMRANNIIPLKYLTTSLGNNKSFTTSKVGFNKAIEATIQRLCDEGVIETLPKQTTFSTFKTRGTCYKLLDLRGVVDGE